MLKRISFQSIPVDDQDRALAFWRDVMGFSVQTDVPYEGEWRWIFLKFPDGPDRLNFDRRRHPPTDQPVLALVSDDVDADCARWREAGVDIVSDPADAPWMPGVRWATFRDSEGNLVFVESWAGP